MWDFVGQQMLATGMNTFRHDYKTHGILIEKVCKMWNTVISKRGVSIQGKENYCSVLEP